MRRALAALLLVSAACGSGSTSPVAVPPSELVFVAGAAVRVYEANDGSPAATLPAGAFDARLSGGGDVAEAYAVGDGVYRVRPGRPFRIDRTADATGAPPYQVALVPGPALQTFVGQKTVLVTLSADGWMAGYQAGTRIWQRSGRPGVLRRLGDLAVFGGGSDWRPVAPETGDLQPAGNCPLCADAFALGEPFELHPVRSAATTLAWPDGTWRSYDAAGTRTGGGRGAGGGRPALAPDGSRLVWPHDYPGATALAFSRDGSFVYALGGGHLRVFPAQARTAVRDLAVDGSDIVLVAGG